MNDRQQSSKPLAGVRRFAPFYGRCFLRCDSDFESSLRNGSDALDCFRVGIKPQSGLILDCRFVQHWKSSCCRIKEPLLWLRVAQLRLAPVLRGAALPIARSSRDRCDNSNCLVADENGAAQHDRTQPSPEVRVSARLICPINAPTCSSEQNSSRSGLAEKRTQKGRKESDESYSMYQRLFTLTLRRAHHSVGPRRNSNSDHQRSVQCKPRTSDKGC